MERYISLPSQRLSWDIRLNDLTLQVYSRVNFLKFKLKILKMLEFSACRANPFAAESI